MSDNALSYGKLSWVLNKSEEGFFLLVASPRMQTYVVRHYLGPSVAALDFLSERRQSYYFTAVASSLAELPEETRSVFLVNFQAVLFEDKDLKRLNFSRDMLSRLGKNLVFCVTPAGQDRILRGALDFSSFLELTMPFEDELPEAQELEQVSWRPEDKSTGVQVDIDWSWTKPRLLARAIALSNQAETRRQAGQYRDAAELLRAALEIRERLLGEKHPDTAGTYNDLGVVYDEMGDYAQALTFYQKALDIKEKALGPEHPDTAGTYNNLANVYANMGDYARAMEFYQKALVIQEKMLGSEHPDAAGTYNNLAIVYDNMGDYAQALTYYQKALDIREKALGPEHPDTATTYNNMAVVYDDMGDYVQALAYYQKALDIREKALGPEHPDTATTYNNMANVYADMGDYAQALAFCQKALDIREKVLGSEHPDTATTYNNLAEVYFDMGNYAQALTLYQKALDIFERKLGPDHPYTQTAKQNLERIRRAMAESQAAAADDHPTPPNDRIRP